MVVLSLGVNILVLIPVLAGLIRQQAGSDAAFGADSVARRILACLYASILVASIGLLVLLVAGHGDIAQAAVATLLCLQVIYKAMTVPAVGLQNPVVKANVAIASLHVVTLIVLFSAGP